MSENDARDLLIDSVADHLDIAFLSGVPSAVIVIVVLQVVAEFLIDKMPKETAMDLMRSACSDLQARMPDLGGDPDAKH